MSPDTTRELSTEQIDSLIEDMQRKAKEWEEGYTDKQFEDMEISELINAIYSTNATIDDKMYAKIIAPQTIRKPQWTKIDWINLVSENLHLRPKSSVKGEVKEEAELPFYKIGNCRISEGPDYVYIQITPKDHQEDQLKLELFIPKYKYGKNYYQENT